MQNTITTEALRGILAQPVPDRWMDWPHQSPHFGTCRFCKQTQITHTSYNVAEADEAATLSCKCREAGEYRTRQAAFEKRTRAMWRISEAIEETFGEGAALSDEEDAIVQDALDGLMYVAALRYDRIFGKITVKLNDTTQAVIDRSKDGNVTIQRKAAKSEKQEIRVD